VADPLPICYLNGEYLPLRDARISPLDRGFLFADSVYEVLPVFAKRPFRFREHFDRLARSLGAIRLASPHSHEEWLAILEGLIERNEYADCYVYAQVSRGAEYGRNHAFPANVAPTVFAMAAPLPQLTPAIQERGIAVVTRQDIRWGRCDIKSTALLANVLVKQEATDAGAQEALLVRDGEVLEGSSTSVLVVIDQVLTTPPNDHRKLPGTTRDVVLELAAGFVPIQVRPIRVEELASADEVWIAAATRDVLPVTSIDGILVGDGRPGPLWHKMSVRFGALRERLHHTPAL
jgi:D-alanine transaminase